MMRHRARVGIGLLALLASPLAVRGDDESKARDKTTEDIVYRTVGDQELKLDLVEPTEGEGPFPALVVIHGGGWRGGNKRDGYVRAVMIGAARRGYVAIAPQYRFCPKEKFPAQVHDVKAAVRWLRTHAEEHKVDAQHIGAVGASAGGHLSLMLGLTGPDDGLEGDVPSDAPSSKVQAVVNYFGPTDLAASDIPEVSKPLVRDFLGGSPLEKFDAARKASPLTYVTPDDPPVLTFQGTRDPLVPYNQALRLAEAQTEAGVPGRVELFVGAGHGFGGPDGAHTAAVAFAFLDRYLKPKP